jgi:hypothetical protein
LSSFFSSNPPWSLAMAMVSDVSSDAMAIGFSDGF